MRQPFDLSHYSFMNGKMNHLQTLSTIPVIAGDSIDLNMRGLFRLAPLRRSLSVDAQIDLFAFYIPHRQIYDTDANPQWSNMIRDGVDSTETLPGVTINASSVNINHYGWRVSQNTTVPKYYIAGYNRIWNRYFRFLKLTPEVEDDWNQLTSARPPGHDATNSPIVSIADQQLYGYPAGRMKTPWSTTITSGITADDHQVPSATVLDILDLEQIQRRYKTEIEREYFNVRYNDILKGVWGSGVNIDADQRPELIQRQTSSLAGYDVDGTADASLGTYTGKSLTNSGMSIRRKFIPEHGMIWVMALLRFPTLGVSEDHPNKRQPSPTYTEIMADPEISMGERPFDDNLTRWFNDHPGAPLGEIPFGQEFRYQPNVMHQQYETIVGYPFMNNNKIVDHVTATYGTGEDYDEVFQTTQLGHWQVQGAIQCRVLRNFPTAAQSIKVGTLSGREH